MKLFVIVLLSLLSSVSAPALADDGGNGLVALVQEGRDLFVGEIHGTQEIPALFVSLVNVALTREEKLFVSLELSSDTRDLSIYSWSGSDGRHSRAMWQLVKRLLELESAGKLNVHFQRDEINMASQSWGANEQNVGEALKQLAAQGQLLALGGNAHSAKKAWRQGTVTPAGAYAGSDVDSIYIMPTGDFKAWACTPTCGIHDFSAESTSPPLMGDLTAGQLLDGEKVAHDYIFTILNTTASLPYTH